MSMNRKRWLQEYALAEQLNPDDGWVSGPNLTTLGGLLSLSWRMRVARKLHRRRGMVCRPLFLSPRGPNQYGQLQARIDHAIAQVVLGSREAV